MFTAPEFTHVDPGRGCSSPAGKAGSCMTHHSHKPGCVTTPSVPAGDMWALGIAVIVLLSGGLAPFPASLLAERAAGSLPDTVQEWLDIHLHTALTTRLGCSPWMQVRLGTVAAAPAHVWL